MQMQQKSVPTRHWYLDGQRVSLAELFVSNVRRLSIEDRRAIIAMKPGETRHLPWGRWSPDVILVCLEGSEAGR